MNVSVGNTWESFIEENIKSGRYMSASEVVREGLRLLQEKEQIRQMKLENLRKEIQKGIDDLDNGLYTELDDEGLDNFFEDLKNEVAPQPKKNPRSKAPSK